MNKGMHRFSIFIYCFTLCVSFFIVPVKAEDVDFYYPPDYSYTAYEYFINKGYSNLMYSWETRGTTTYTVDLHNTGTINSNNSTLGSKYLVCTTNNAVSGTQTYSCYFSSTQSGVANSQSINIKLNENTYTSGSVTTPYYNYYQLRYKLPWLTGTYTHNNSFTTNDYFYITDELDCNLYFLAKIYNNPTYNLYTQRGNEVLVDSSVESISNTMRLYKYHFYLPEGVHEEWVTLDIPFLNTTDVLPIFMGPTKRITDDVREFIGEDTKVNHLLEIGNDNTTDCVNDGNNANIQVSNKIGEFDSIENNSIIDMNSNINNLNLTSDILSNSKFLSSANWVKIQFDRMTVHTPIGSVLSFSLILGITLIFLGKIR